MKKLVGLLAALCCMIFAGTVFAATEISDDGYVEVTGVGEPGQSYSAGIRAAELVAYRKAAEAIGDMQLTSDSTVKQGITTDDTIRTKLNAVIHQAKIVEEHKGTDGYYYATVRVPIFGSHSVASAVLPKVETPEPLPQPTVKVVPESAGVHETHDTIVVRGGYTGVIIDCRGLGLVTAMSPIIKSDNGTKLYGYKNLESAKVIHNGMASYSKSMTANVARAGSHPLIIKAVSVDGFGAKCNPVISTMDANRMLAENAKTHFLENCAVVFVR